MGRHWSRESKITPYVAKTDADDAYKLSHAPKFKNAEQYVEAKLKMLTDPRGFCIKVTETESNHLYELAREMESKHFDKFTMESKINRAVRQIINNHWR